MSSDQADELTRRIAEFITITGASTSVAQGYLDGNDQELEPALEQYFEDSISGQPQQRSSASPAPAPAPSATTKRNQFRTFQDMVNGGNEDTSEDDDVNLFTGGEKSALLVENPNKNNPANLVQDILRKANDPNNGARQDSDELGESSRKQFTGAGFKLGDSQTPSSMIPDRSAKKPEKVERKITFWKDGFSVGEGKLYRYDDPRNGAYLRDLNSGRAPLELLDVKMGQDVDVNVDKRLDEEYKPPKRKMGGFTGSGHRLGSPVPGEVATEAQEPVAAPVAAPAKVEDQGEGDTKLQIRLADGTRIIHKFNSSDPVQLIYDLVTSHTSDSRPFFLSLPFPVKPLDDKEISIKDAGLLNAAVIQRWK